MAAQGTNNAVVSATIDVNVKHIEDLREYERAVNDAAAATERLIKLQGNAVNGDKSGYVAKGGTVTFSDGSQARDSKANRAQNSQRHRLDDLGQVMDLRAGRITPQQMHEYATEQMQDRRTRNDAAMTGRLQRIGEEALRGENSKGQRNARLSVDRAVEVAYTKSGKKDLDLVLSHYESRMKDQTLTSAQQWEYAVRAAKEINKHLQMAARESKQGRALEMASLTKQYGENGVKPQQRSAITRRMQSLAQSANDDKERQVLETRMNDARAKHQAAQTKNAEKERVETEKAAHQRRIGEGETELTRSGGQNTSVLAAALRDAAKSQEYSARERVKMENRADRLDARKEQRSQSESDKERKSTAQEERRQKTAELHEQIKSGKTDEAENARKELVQHYRTIANSKPSSDDSVTRKERSSARTELVKLQGKHNREALIKEDRSQHMEWMSAHTDPKKTEASLQKANESYRKYLSDRLANAERFGAEWKRIFDKIDNVDGALMRGGPGQAIPGYRRSGHRVHVPYYKDEGFNDAAEGRVTGRNRASRRHSNHSTYREALEDGANPMMLMSDVFMPRNLKGRAIGAAGQLAQRSQLRWDTLGIGYTPMEMAQGGLDDFIQYEDAKVRGDIPLQRNASAAKFQGKKDYDSQGDIDALNLRLRRLSTGKLPSENGVSDLFKYKEEFAKANIRAVDMDKPIEYAARFQRLVPDMKPDEMSQEIVKTINSMQEVVLRDARKKNPALKDVTNVYDKRVNAVGNFLGTVSSAADKTGATEEDVFRMQRRIAGAAGVAGISQEQSIGFSALMANVGIRPDMGGTSFSEYIRDLNSSAKSYQPGQNGQRPQYDDRMRMISQAMYGGKTDKDIDAGAAKFSSLMQKDAGEGVAEFTQQLQDFQKAGEDVPKLLKMMGFDGARMIDVLTRLGNASDPFKELVKSLRTAGDASESLVERTNPLMNTLGARVNRLKEGMRELGRQFVESFGTDIEKVLETFQQFIGVFGKLIGMFASLPPGVREVMLQTMALVIALRGTMVVIAPLIQAFGAVYNLQLAIAQLGFANAVIVPIRNAMAALTATVPGTTAVMTANAGAITANAGAATAAAGTSVALRTSLMALGRTVVGLTAILIAAAAAYHMLSEMTDAYNQEAKATEDLMRVQARGSHAREANQNRYERTSLESARKEYDKAAQNKDSDGMHKAGGDIAAISARFMPEKERAGVYEAAQKDDKPSLMAAYDKAHAEISRRERGSEDLANQYDKEGNKKDPKSVAKERQEERNKQTEAQVSDRMTRASQMGGGGAIGIDQYLLALRQKASDSDYAKKPDVSASNKQKLTNSGAYGYSRGRWDNYGGYSEAYLAPKEIQDKRAKEDALNSYRKNKGNWDGMAAGEFRYMSGGSKDAKAKKAYVESLDVLSGSKVQKGALSSIFNDPRNVLNPTQMANMQADKAAAAQRNAEARIQTTETQIGFGLDDIEKGKPYNRKLIEANIKRREKAQAERDGYIRKEMLVKGNVKGIQTNGQEVNALANLQAETRKRDTAKMMERLDDQIFRVKEKKLRVEMDSMNAVMEELRAHKEELSTRLSLAVSLEQQHLLRKAILAKERQIADLEFAKESKRVQAIKDPKEKENANRALAAARTSKKRSIDTEETQSERDLILGELDRSARMREAQAYKDVTDEESVARANKTDQELIDRAKRYFAEKKGKVGLIDPAQIKVLEETIAGRNYGVTKNAADRDLNLEEARIADNPNEDQSYIALVEYQKNRRKWLDKYDQNAVPMFDEKAKEDERQADIARRQARAGNALFDVATNNSKDMPADIAKSRGEYEAALQRSRTKPERTAISSQQLDVLGSTYQSQYNHQGGIDKKALQTTLREMDMIRGRAKDGEETAVYTKAGEDMAGLVGNVLAKQYQRIDRMNSRERLQAVRATNELLKLIPEWQKLPPELKRSLEEGMKDKETQERDARPGFRKATIESRKSIEGGVSQSFERLGGDLISGALGREDGGRKQTVKRFWDSILAVGTDSLAHVAWEGVLKPQLTKVFEGLKEHLTHIWQQGEGSWSRMIGASMAVMNAALIGGAGGKKAKKGATWGGLLGAGIGFATGGPAGALMGFNVGSSAGAATAEGGIGAGLLAGAGSYAAQKGPGLFGNGGGGNAGAGVGGGNAGAGAGGSGGGFNGPAATVGNAAGAAASSGKSRAQMGSTVINNTTINASDRQTADYAAQRIQDRTYRATHVGA